MYNLMFVDDEKRVLEAMCNIIPWDTLNIRVIGVFDNAVNALQTFIDERPDILITDIMMPVMDGLELISRAKEMYPPIECLVLSGYEEFELAKSAIAYGVRGYLVKPCRKEELIENVCACIKSIEARRTSSLLNYEMRQNRIEDTYDKLMNVAWDDDVDHEVLIRKIAKQLGDFGVLKEAAIMMAVQHEISATKFQMFVTQITKPQNTEALIQNIVDLLCYLKSQAPSADPIVSKAVQYVYNNYHVPSLNLQHVADTVIHLTPRYIGKRFLKAMNMKFSEFLLQVRMEKAKELVREMEFINANDIAARVGLGNNVQYFYRLFRQYTGKTMREYKESLARKE